MSAVKITFANTTEGDVVLTMRIDGAVARDAGRCVHVREALGRRVAAELQQLAPGGALVDTPGGQ